MLLHCPGAASALDKCSAKINTTDGTILVGAKSVSGSLLWGNTAGTETNAFADPGCVVGDTASKCRLGTGAVAITPPPLCTLYLKDGSGTCSTFIKKCTPGARQSQIDAIEARLPAGAYVRRVFATSTSSTGNKGGLDGADAICQARADAANLGGKWIAYLSTSQVDARSRLTPGAGSFTLVNGTVIAMDWEDLYDVGGIAAAINRDEFGAPRGALGVGVLTGSNRNGTKAADTCSDWTTTTGSTLTGSTSETDSYWGGGIGPSGCNFTFPLFCFEQ
jgi:hypothetical protein